MRSHISQWFRWSSVVVGVLFAAFVVVGYAVYHAYVVGDVAFTSAAPVRCVVFVALAVSFWLIVEFSYRRLDDFHARADVRERATEADGTLFMRLFFRLGWKCAALLFVCWLPYLIVRFPGNLDPDTFWQILQTVGLTLRSNQDPWFDTMIFGAFWNVGTALGDPRIALSLYAVLQMAASALSFSVMIVYLRFAGAPRWFHRACTLFCALFPFIALSVQTMAKDMLFAWVWVLFLVCVCHLVRTRGSALRSIRFVLIFAAVIAVMCLTKKTGVYIVGITALVLLPYLRGGRVRLCAVVAVPVVLYLVFWSALLLPAKGIASGGSTEMLSVPAQQTACVLIDHGDELTADDRAILEAVFEDVDSLPVVYTPQRADATKAGFRGRSDTSISALLRYMAWIAEAQLRFPDSCARALGALDLQAYYPFYDSDNPENGLYIPDNLLPSHDGFGIDIASMVTRADADPETARRMSELSAPLLRDDDAAAVPNAVGNGILAVEAALMPLCNKALYVLWLPLFVLAYAARRRSKTIALCMVPVVLMAATILVGPIVLPRYLVSVVYATPLVAGVLFLNMGRGSLTYNPSEKYATDEEPTWQTESRTSKKRRHMPQPTRRHLPN